MTDLGKKKFRAHLDAAYEANPELFARGMAQGYSLCGVLHSTKMELKTRRIRLKSNQKTYQIRPSFAMPYMIGWTDELENPSIYCNGAFPLKPWLMCLVVTPCTGIGLTWLLAFGRASLVGTTVKTAEKLPQDLLADEKHSRHQGQKVYITTTVGQECILGADLADNAGADALEKGYQTFKTEVREVAPGYQPTTVNTDGWRATQKAWLALFPGVTIILCFLHAWLKIKQRCQRNQPLGTALRQKVWHVYHAQTVPQFAQRVRRLREWGEAQLSSVVQEKVLKLCHNAPHFKKAFAYPSAHRTSNMLDRLMNYQDRLLYGGRTSKSSQKKGSVLLNFREKKASSH
ncbi:MAG: hypothetical protein HND44_20835 [Chloroflexi bacterium]|nr:hypothetical protein [Ardenticatenaceae bacterium]NOG36988.1 hypothetical protein [Chloroflexota bacterium]